MHKSKKQPKPTSDKSRRRVIKEWGLQLGLLIAVLTGITMWKTRGMVSSGAPAPTLSVTDLKGHPVDLSDDSGKRVLLYFFAPWCSVCHASSHNINAMRKAYSHDELAIYAVGLGWERIEELIQFAEKHALTVPVLVGTRATAAAYKVTSFPSLYILDEEHRIAHRLVGYATEWGLRFRTATAGLF